jgi:D-alanyl-D-alanine carboxypeptidase
MMPEKKPKYQKYLTLVVSILAMVVFGSGGYAYYKIAKDIVLNSVDLSSKVIELEDEKVSLIELLRSEKEKNNAFSGQISEIIGTVSKLDKLSKTDKELLQKYSKIYFLNENYVPEDLIDIPPDYIYEQGRKLKMHTKAYPYLQSLIVAAEADGIDLRLISAYRSFGEQSALKNTYAVMYGSGANRFSADQGYSEHQLGTALDFTTKELGADFTSFKKSDAYKWFLENAYKYGFILSYPEDNKYYQFEPWHFRFVGKSLANRLHQENENFYDLDQRTIDNYLINIFD